MQVILKPTTKVVEINGVEARIWEGKTDKGIIVHAYITRIAIDNNEPEENQKDFYNELQQRASPTPAIQSIPLRLLI